MTKPSTATMPCPDVSLAGTKCEGTMLVFTDGFVGESFAPGFLNRDAPVPWRKVQKPFAACMACEFCAEVVKQGGVWCLKK